MTANAPRRIRERAKPIRKILAGTVLFFLGRGLVAAVRVDSRVRDELRTWPTGTIVTIAIAPDGPQISWEYRAGRLAYLGRRIVKPTIAVTYKSVDVALPVLIGRQGILSAFAEHRSTLLGDIGLGMSLVRCLHIVESYLFPDVIGRNVLPGAPSRQVSHVRAYAALVFPAANVEGTS
ncbi:MAG: hypothetical protein HGB10_06265 [Coriobacteriia bacterium]|nr:hypothetical protein [Coriobacteriia bacterium]